MTEREHHFEVPVTWSGDAKGSGEARLGEGAIPVPIAGAVVLGGAGGKANPEELLLAALGACFANTWAIFVTKLGVALPTPSVRASAAVGPDPAGGFRLVRAVLRAQVPAALLAADREKVEKTLKLAEKYCIVSKAVRAAMPLEVEVDEV